MNQIKLIFVITATIAALGPRAHAQGGVPLWTNTYNSPANDLDEAYAMTVDSNGNVFVTGYSTGTYYQTIKYSNAGVPLWVKRYGVSGGNVATAIAVDGSGNVFVTGFSVTSNVDYATVKYSSAGVLLWVQRFNGPANGDDYPSGMAVDSNANVFVTGYSTGSSSGYDYATIKYSNAGAPLWTNFYNGPANTNDSSAAIAVDSSGNVFVTGYSTSSGTGKDYATIKYSNAGVPLWTNYFNGPGNGDDLATAIAVDSSGNVFVTGSSGNDYATIKYSNAGVPSWTNFYKGPGTGAGARAIAVDSSGNVFATGFSTGTNGNEDYATIKYSGAGVPLWTNLYNGPGYAGSVPNALAMDRIGNAFVTGYSVTNGYLDWATIAYSGAGVPLWTNRYNGAANRDDIAYAIATDSSGNVFVTGYSWSFTSNYDYMTIKYSSSIPVPPRLDFQVLNNQLVLTWTNAAFSLQTASEVTASFIKIPGATSRAHLDTTTIIGR
jgi:uncharacterized delta-60 repeat protein